MKSTVGRCLRELVASVPQKVGGGVLLAFFPLSMLIGGSGQESKRADTVDNTDQGKDSLSIGNYPTGFFGSPLDIPLNLSGNFGELRTNHFHAGIDLKTQQQEGLKVYASAGGYVSRIKVSPVGYGYAIYIDHPNGYTTVYGHLKSYADKFAQYVFEKQYEQQSFAVDLFPAPGALPVEKGEVIALSGNSGGSGGPHLHFEIRETVTEKVLNPLLFGFDIKDKIPPSVNGIWIIPMNDSTSVNGGKIPLSFPTRSTSGNCLLKSSVTPTVYGEIAFAIHTSDMLDGNTNRCGIYRIELFVDGLQIYGQRMDRLDFATNRAMNAHTLYERYKKDRSQIHGSYRLPGNPLDIYDNLVNDGIVTLKDGKDHQVEYRVVDIMGNESTVKFKVHAAASSKEKPKRKRESLAHFDWEQDNSYESDEIKLNIPAFALYEDVDLTITKKEKMAGAITPTYIIVSPYEPLHEKYSLCIRVDNLEEKYRDKAVVVRWDPDKDKIIAESSSYKDGFVCASPIYLGYFGVKIDTVAPVITNTDFTANMKGRTQFSFRISDWLSGIDSYTPTIDGKWALMEYDAKTNRLTYYFDPSRIRKGKHSFGLTVCDMAGNEKSFSENFEW
ncbi:MAG: M23 family metallopeptidase [Crocinitomicaceae bacterium]|nr:M23 family metallopeptidase [Crocinitomicaceae bacterium]